MAASTPTSSEHRVVTIVANDDGTYTAKLYSDWQYEDPYERSHLESVTLNGEEFTLSAGERKHFSDIEVNLNTDSIALTTQ